MLIRYVPMALVCLWITGCAYGVTTMKISAMEIGDKKVCCQVEYESGKEYDSFNVEAEKKGLDYKIKLSAKKVEAFEGQKIAAENARKIVKDVVEATVEGLKPGL